MEIVKLFFSGPLHLSKGQMDEYGQSDEIIHSDTIKSAIFVMAHKIFGDKIDKSFFDAFQISSAFPFCGNEYFFPKPMVRLELDEDDTSKFFKKIGYLGKSYFEKILSGKKIMLSKEYASPNGKFLFSKKEDVKPVFKSVVQQRVALSPGKDSVPYYVDRLFYGKTSGMYFFIEIKEPSIRSILESSLQLLGDEGIGTDRSVGNGHFKPVWDKVKLNLPENANSKICLSLYCPNEVELPDYIKNSSYQLLRRGGYITSAANSKFNTFRKRSVYMFSEGSVFPSKMNTTGKLIDLSPIAEPIKGLNHPIWREGRPFFLPIKVNNYV